MWNSGGLTQKTSDGRQRIDSTVSAYLAKLDGQRSSADAAFNSNRIDDCGKIVEEAFVELLQPLLPLDIGFARGSVCSSGWRTTSREIDIILYDRTYAAGFPIKHSVGHSVGVINVDAVLACISVKKTLTQEELKDACEGLATLDELDSARPTNFLRIIVGLDFPFAPQSGSTKPVLKSHQAAVGATAASMGPLDPLVGQKWAQDLRLDLLYSADGIVAYPLQCTNEGALHVNSADLFGIKKHWHPITVKNSALHVGHPDLSSPQVTLACEDYRSPVGQRHAALRIFLVCLTAALTQLRSRTGHPQHGLLLPHISERPVQPAIDKTGIINPKGRSV
jgi:hypothetical protein